MQRLDSYRSKDKSQAAAAAGTAASTKSSQKASRNDLTLTRDPSRLTFKPSNEQYSRSPHGGRPDTDTPPLLFKRSDEEHEAVYIDDTNNSVVQNWIQENSQWQDSVDTFVKDLSDNESFLMRQLDTERERTVQAYAYTERLLKGMRMEQQQHGGGGSGGGGLSTKQQERYNDNVLGGV